MAAGRQILLAIPGDAMKWSRSMESPFVAILEQCHSAVPVEQIKLRVRLGGRIPGDTISRRAKTSLGKMSPQFGALGSVGLDAADESGVGRAPAPS